MTEPNAFGAFLRSRRHRLTPADVGMRPTRRRRTKGLRREEVAERAGIGVDWYIRLEQGRATRPSTTTVDSLARALLLDPAEHAHLRALADAPSRPPFRRERVPDGVARIVRGLNQPAYLTGQRWDVLAWNEAAANLFGDLASMAEEDRNIFLFMFTDAGARRLFGRDWAQEAQRMIALFRANYDYWAGDAAFEDLLDRVRGACPEFAKWWDKHDVRDAANGRKTLHFADGRSAAFDYASFQANDDPALRLSIYTPC